MHAPLSNTLSSSTPHRKAAPPPKILTRFRVSWRRAGWSLGTATHYRLLAREDLAIAFARRLRERVTEHGGCLLVGMVPTSVAESEPLRLQPGQAVFG